MATCSSSRYSVYLLYWYKGAHTDAAAAVIGTQAQRPPDAFEKARFGVPGVGTYETQGPRERSASVVMGSEPRDMTPAAARAQVPASVCVCVCERVNV